MENVKTLLDAVKKAKGIESDYALAKALEINKARISAYYSGKEAPNEFACLQIAEALDRTLDQVLAIVRIEAEKDEKRREVWQKYYKSIGGYAASFMLVLFCFVTLIVTSAEVVAKESTTYKEQMTRNTNYASIARIIRGLVLAVRHTLYNVLPRFCFVG